MKSLGKQRGILILLLLLMVNMISLAMEASNGNEVNRRLISELGNTKKEIVEVFRPDGSKLSEFILISKKSKKKLEEELFSRGVSVERPLEEKMNMRMKEYVLYRRVTKYDNKGRIKNFREKSFLASVDEKIYQMIVPIKNIRVDYSYYDNGNIKKIKSKKVYKKLHKDGREKAATDFEANFVDIFYDSKLLEYNKEDLLYLVNITTEDLDNLVIKEEFNYDKDGNRVEGF